MRKLSPIFNITKFKEKLFAEDNTSFAFKACLVFMLSLGLTAFLIQIKTSQPTTEPRQELQSIDTLIPNDQGLVTIQVANYESLDQIIGQYGVVDLYSVPLVPGEKARLVVRKVKLVRAPKSPRHFNVLLPASEVGILAGYSGEFTVSVRNPQLFGTKIVKEKAKPTRRKISFETESL